MRKSKFSEHQIVAALKRAESGMPVKDICRELEMTSALFYLWRSKYSGVETSNLKGIKVLEEENRRLEQIYAELSLDHKLLKEIVERQR